MSWFLPCLMFALSAVFFRLAHLSEEILTAWLRFIVFVVFLILAVLLTIGNCVS